MSAEHVAPLPPGAPQVSAEEFKAVFRHHPAGVAVVTLRAGARPAGFTATSVISVSAGPPILAFSLAATSSLRPAVEATESLVVHFLADDQRDVAARFAARGVDRFVDAAWAPLPTGEPVLTGTTTWVRCLVEDRIAVGDSLLVTARVVATSGPPEGEALVYRDRTYHRLGAALG
ncbi:flavin reductase family protein [Georgenia faecalis]|uniref:flavin reductase family protein n=1 Tax=Georgenia faecalis TaxID=2483799 RepID=UPI000FD8AE1E|nr:flavin reductase family protein [Georgenia faecalis]